MIGQISTLLSDFLSQRAIIFDGTGSARLPPA
jgi:hypothetical protein